eukprot:520530-Lingulodinium_polyedra.AAC.1
MVPKEGRAERKKEVEKELRDDTTAAAKIKDFDDKNPARGRGFKRSTFEGATQTQDFVQGRMLESDTPTKLMDLIEYAKTKERERGWDFEKSKAQWDILRLDP